MRMRSLTLLGLVTVVGCGDDRGGGGGAACDTTSAVTTGGPASTTASGSNAASGSTSVGTSSTGASSTTTGMGPSCGDDVCEGGETAATCCVDCGCPTGATCVDGLCEIDPFCGDATCNGDDTQETCCVDCGCAAGSTCTANMCLVDPVCGDGSCNGLETRDTCCQDCTCAAGWICGAAGACEEVVCGDGVCNGAETPATCCTDCGCADPAETCTNGACTCPDASGRFENVLVADTQFCGATGMLYTREPIAYVNNITRNSGWNDLPEGGAIVFHDPQHTSYDMMEQCCYLDSCDGNLLCPTPFGNELCLCAPVAQFTVTLDACGETTFPVCD